MDVPHKVTLFTLYLFCEKNEVKCNQGSGLSRRRPGGVYILDNSGNFRHFGRNIPFVNSQVLVIFPEVVRYLSRFVAKGCLYLYVAMYVVLSTTSYMYVFFIELHLVLRPIWLLYIVNPLPNWTQANSY